MSVPAAALLALRRLSGTSQDVERLQAVFDGAPGYVRRVTGAPREEGAGRSMFTDRPAEVSPDDLLVFAIERGGDALGCAAMLRGFPTAEVAYVGLLLLAERAHGRGDGGAAWRLLEAEIRGWGSCTRARLGVVRTNDIALGFWTRMGFSLTGERKPWDVGGVASEVLLLEKAL